MLDLSLILIECIFCPQPFVVKCMYLLSYSYIVSIVFVCFLLILVPWISHFMLISWELFGSLNLTLCLYASFHRHGLQQSVYQAVQSIVTQLLNERVTQPVVYVILRNLVKEDKVHYLLSFFASWDLQYRQILRIHYSIQVDE